MSRRESVASTAFALSPARALGAADRIRFGVIGVGGMGGAHLGSLLRRSDEDNIQVAAVSDVYNRRLNRAKAACRGEGYPDYRKLLDRKDIDAVLIATPDHWHAKISMDALEAGKHVYCEKPMTHTIEQAIAFRNAARTAKTVVQIGPNGTANDSYYKGLDAVRAGRLGRVTWAQGSYNRNARICLFNEHQKVDPAAGPHKTGDDYIDWDMWLGHKWGLAPRIPWTPDHFFRFRKYWRYNGGVATDLLYHKLAPLLITLAGPDGAYPSRVSATGGQYIEKDGRDIPDTFLMTADYPQGFSLFLVSTLTNDTQLPDRVYGKFGTMDLGGEPYLRGNGDMMSDFMAANDGQTELRLAVKPRRDMEGTFIDAIRGICPPACSAELGCATMVAIKMAVESYRKSRMLVWDQKRERVVG
jgi:predicted dehydrogenase